MTESEKLVPVRPDHVAGAVSALQHDVNGLSPETVGEDAIGIAAIILAYIEELHRVTPHGVAVMLAIVDDIYDPDIRQWAKVTYDFVEGDELRRANRQLELAMYGARQRYQAWEAWKRDAGEAPRAAERLASTTSTKH
jgi:hypothetical protein